MFFFFLVALTFVLFPSIPAAVTSSMSDEQSSFWDDNRVISTMCLLEETSYGYHPTLYSEFIKIIIESLLFYRPIMTLKLLSNKPILFIIFFWSMYGGILDEAAFPPEGFSFNAPVGVEKLKIHTILVIIVGAIDSGLIADDKVTREIISKILV
jgi:hypothetical protein